MSQMDAVVEIEKRDGAYRVELLDRETGAAIDDAVVGGVDDSETSYKHACKVRLPDGAEPRIGLEAGETPRVVLRAAGRTCYRHELPTRLAAN